MYLFPWFLMTASLFSTWSRPFTLVFIIAKQYPLDSWLILEKSELLHSCLMADSGRTPPNLSDDVLLSGPVHLVESTHPTSNSSHFWFYLSCELPSPITSDITLSWSQCLFLSTFSYEILHMTWNATKLQWRKLPQACRSHNLMAQNIVNLNYQGKLPLPLMKWNSCGISALRLLLQEHFSWQGPSPIPEQRLHQSDPMEPCISHCYI